MLTKETLQIITADLDADIIEEAGPRELTESTLDVQEEPLPEIKLEDTDHMTSLKKIMNFYQILSLFFGHRISYDWNPYHFFFFWLAWISVSFGAFSIVYTVYVHHGHGNYGKIIEAFAIFGTTASCMMKWIFFLTHWRQIISILIAPKKWCRENPSGPGANIINAGLRRTLKVLKVFAVGVLVCVSFYVIVPLKFYFMDDILMPLIPIEMIFCDTSTLLGLITATAIQGHLGVYSSLAILMYGSGFLICTCNYTFLVNLIEQDFKDLDEMWKRNSTTSIAYRHAFLVNICKKLQDMKSYMAQVKEIYELKLFLYFISTYLGQVVCLYQITENNWIPGYTISIIAFIEMMFYCLIGTQLIKADEKVYHTINNTNWYEYDTKSQRVLLILQHERQQVRQVQLGFMGPLNVITGIQVLKGIYSYYTVLTEVL